MGEKRDPKTTGILKTNKIIEVSASLSVITLIVNGLNSPVKRYNLAKCVKKKGRIQTRCCLSQETNFSFKDTHRLKVKRWGKKFHINSNEKRTGIALLISDRIDLR